MVTNVSGFPYTIFCLIKNEGKLTYNYIWANSKQIWMCMQNFLPDYCAKKRVFCKIIIFTYIQPILLSSDLHGLADNLENSSVNCSFVLLACHANWFPMHAKFKKIK